MRQRSHADEEFKARKLELQKRLTREGRWKEADAFKEEVRKECRRKGMSADDSVKTAWDEMERNYPVMSEEEIEVSREPPVVEVKGGVVEVVVPEKSPRGIRVWIPPDWGELPATAKYEEEVEWVHQNYILAVERSASGDRLKLGRARSKAPSMGAVGLLEWAMLNRAAFYKDVLPKVKKVGVEGEGELVAKERRSIEEIRGIIKRMEEVV